MVRFAFGVFVALLVIPASASGQVELRPAPVPGSTLVIETTTRLDQKLTIAGMETATDVESNAKVLRTVGQREPSGKLKAEEQTQSFRVTMNAGGMNYTFDSAKPGERGNSPLDMLLRDIHRAIAQRKTTIVYTADNRVDAIQLDQDIIGGLPVQTQDLVRNELSPEHMKETANQQLDQFPSEPVQPGDTWEGMETVHFGAGQVMTFTTKYTYAGPENKNGRMLDKITSETTGVTFALEKSPLPLTLKNADLKPVDSRGTMFFDRATTTVAESQSELHVVGDITFEANNMELPSKLDLTIRSTVTSAPQ